MTEIVEEGGTSKNYLERLDSRTDSSSSSSGSDIEECFLRACRNGDLEKVTNMIEGKEAGKYSFDISCKGQSKSNLGWTPLHLATYFGHKEVVEVLLDRGAEVDAINGNGDTPLHTSSFIGREDLVMLLIQYNANVNLINGEGRLPREMTPATEAGDEIAKLLKAAEATEMLRKEGKLLMAARDGNLELLNNLLKDNHPPNINCVDAQGNSSLHCASYRGHKEIAVLLLQNGIDTSIRNKRGQLALDLARDAQTLQVLSVKAVRKVQRTATRFEGPLLKRSRFLGWKPVWAVLERGVLNYYSSRADSTARDNKRQDYKYLDSARVTPLPTDLSSFVIHFNDGSVHRLCVISNTTHGELTQVGRQKWINSLNEHAAYSSHYLWGIDKRKSNSDDEFGSSAKPLGSMTDALSSATASFEVLQRQLGESALMVEALQKSLEASDSSSSSLPISAMMVGHSQLSYLRFQLVSETAANMMASLEHCLTLFHQQEEIRVQQLNQEKEKCRVLEEALNILAKEHHELEQSVANHISETGTIPRSLSARMYDTDDEFFDAFDADSDTDTLVTADSIFNSPAGSVQDLTLGEGTSGRQKRLKNRNRSASTHTLTNENGHTSSSSSTSTESSSSHSIPSQASSVYHTQHSTFSKSVQETHSSDSNSSDSGTLVDNISLASSCVTLISEGGDAYKCARSEFYCGSNRLQPPSQDLIDFRPSGNYRKQLPVAMFSRNDFNIWSVLKNCIGKELSKITMPVIFNEPLSFLQRISEVMEYAKLLRIAANQDNSVDRLKYVTAFVISSLSSNWDRLGKPFNPLLGETFEIERDEFRMVCEQVSHHPPVSAFHSDANDFVLHGWCYPKLKFWGKSIEIQPKGLLTVEFPKTGDAFTWSGVNCCIHNIIVGKLWMEHFGQLEITNHKTGDKAVINIKPAGWSSKDIHRVEGFIVDKNKKKLLFLYGKHTDFLRCTSVESYNEYFKENSHKFKRHDDHRSKSPNESPAHTPRKVLSKLNSLKMSSFKSLSIHEPEDYHPDSMPEGEIPKSDSAYSIDIPDSTTLWEVTPRPEASADYFHFTLFAMSLNEMEKEMAPPTTLCPTDSRLRPDIRALENGDLDGAASEKTRLEEQQRERDKKKKKTSDFVPRWFKQCPNPHNKSDDWLYTGGYWDRNYKPDPELEGIF